MTLVYPITIPASRWVWHPEGWRDSAPAVGEESYAHGAVVPGWVNAHCHLELSHLRGAVGRGTGQAGFARAVAALRNVGPKERLSAQRKALQDQAECGVVAVGDIANTDDTLQLMAQANTLGLCIHTFVEVLGMNPQLAEARYAAGTQLAQRFRAATVVPHAPYSVSRELFSLIWQSLDRGPLSLHFHESAEEVELFATNMGPLAELLHDWGLPLPPGGQTPADWALSGRPSGRNLLLVHCVEPLPAHVAVANGVFIVLCPRSNQYIHGTLPPVPQLLEAGARLCIGTDSLASNTSLNPLEELKCLTEAYPEQPLHSLVKWATVNGAMALGLEPERLAEKPILLHPLGIHEGLPTLLPETQATPLARKPTNF